MLYPWQVLESLERIERKLDKMAIDLAAATAAVAAQTTIEASVETLLTQLTTEIKNLIASSGNTVDPVALQAIVDGIIANNTKLSAAVVANTPAAS